MAADKLPRLVMFPGLGLDGRLFEPQRPVAEIHVPDWIDPESGESLAEYSRRLAATIQTPRPFWLGGVSFGAFVALEVARHVESCGVFMISGCLSWRSIPAPLLALSHLAPKLPTGLFAHCAPFAPPTLALLGERLNWKQVSLITSMFAVPRPKLIQWGLGALRGWTFEVRLPAPVYHIHGRHDRMLPIKNVRAGEVVPGGGHVINVSHAPQVNAFIARHVAEGCGSTPRPFSAAGEAVGRLPRLTADGVRRTLPMSGNNDSGR